MKKLLGILVAALAVGTIAWAQGALLINGAGASFPYSITPTHKSTISQWAFIVRYAADLLNGVPSIVIGIFAYVVVVVRFRHFSALAGGFALGLMMIPITLRSTEHFLIAVPRALREGASKWKVIYIVQGQDVRHPTVDRR
jgi:ABC-type phosphate transport system permease subunit